MRTLLINLIATLVFAVAVSPDAVAAGDVPDFNYPQTVMKNADKSLDKALKKGNHADVVKYLIQTYC